MLRGPINYYSGEQLHNPSKCQSEYDYLAKSSYCYAVRGNIFESEIFSFKYIYGDRNNASSLIRNSKNRTLRFIRSEIENLPLYDINTVSEDIIDKMVTAITCYIKYDRISLNFRNVRLCIKN